MLNNTVLWLARQISHWSRVWSVSRTISKKWEIDSAGTRVMAIRVFVMTGKYPWGWLPSCLSQCCFLLCLKKRSSCWRQYNELWIHNTFLSFIITDCFVTGRMNSSATYLIRKTWYRPYNNYLHAERHVTELAVICTLSSLTHFSRSHWYRISSLKAPVLPTTLCWMFAMVVASFTISIIPVVKQYRQMELNMAAVFN